MRRPYDSSRDGACGGAAKLKKGPWTADEDRALIEYMVENNSWHHNWQLVPMLAGIKRCGKSCRLRWINYLRPGINRSAFTHEEDMIIINLHSIMGNRWAAIARALPGRTDNDIKNHWNTNLGKKLLAMGIDPRTHSLLPDDLHPDFMRLQADIANFFAKLNRRVTSCSTLLPFWSNNAPMAAPLEDDGFESYTGAEYDGTVDLQQLATVSAPCLDVTIARTGSDAGISSDDWCTVNVLLNEPPANMAASHLFPKCDRFLTTESTVSSQFEKITHADLGKLEDDSDEFWNKLLNY